MSPGLSHGQTAWEASRGGVVNCLRDLDISPVPRPFVVYYWIFKEPWFGMKPYDPQVLGFKVLVQERLARETNLSDLSLDWCDQLQGKSSGRAYFPLQPRDMF